MTEVGVHEAKTHLSRLPRRLAQGEEIAITSWPPGCDARADAWGRTAALRHG